MTGPCAAGQARPGQATGGKQNKPVHLPDHHPDRPANRSRTAPGEAVSPLRSRAERTAVREPAVRRRHRVWAALRGHAGTGSSPLPGRALSVLQRWWECAPACGWGNQGDMRDVSRNSNVRNTQGQTPE